MGLGYEGDTCLHWDGVPQDVEWIVCEVVGGVIRVSGTGSCVTSSAASSERWSYIAMPNVAIWAADPSTHPDASGLAFESGDSRFLDDKLFVAEDPGSDGCPLEAEDTVRVGSALYRHESRAVLLDASPGGGRESKSRVCAPRGHLNGETCEVLPPGLGCRVACATPGEVPNRPRLGHQMHIWGLYNINGKSFTPSTDFDNNYAGTLGADWRGAIWLEKALRGDDQLRQRVAWALAQIMVVAVPGLSQKQSHELYVNFYDIFVRNAFGSFGRLLREVTYSPVMATYLTYLNSKATDSDGTYPDENYAREIMQLFTIGTELLEQDGSQVRDQQGEPVPSYDNEDIMSFARVFTGFFWQPIRRNLEITTSVWHNWVDHLRMRGEYHDVYPKVDLQDGYLGDGLPLCQDAQSGDFLRKGARFEAMETGPDSGVRIEIELVPYVLNLTSGSALFQALCRAPGPGGACNFAATLELAETLACSGPECDFDHVRAVLVGDTWFEHVPPPCVHLFFHGEARVAVRWDDSFSWWKGRRCADPRLPLAAASCCNQTHEDVLCGAPMTFARAEARCAGLGMAVCNKKVAVEKRCDGMRGRIWTPEACGQNLTVYDDGKVSSKRPEGMDMARNSFSVAWEGAAPVPGEYPVVAELAPAFDRVPARGEALAALKIGAFPPTVACTHGCQTTGAVKAYAAGGLDEHAVFEVDGRFLRNAVSRVKVTNKVETVTYMFIYDSYV